MKTSPRGFARRNVWRQFIVTFAAIVSLFQSAFAQSGRTDQESPPQAPAVNDPNAGQRFPFILGPEVLLVQRIGLPNSAGPVSTPESFLPRLLGVSINSPLDDPNDRDLGWHNLAGNASSLGSLSLPERPAPQGGQLFCVPFPNPYKFADLAEEMDRNSAREENDRYFFLKYGYWPRDVDLGMDHLTDWSEFFPIGPEPTPSTPSLPEPTPSLSVPNPWEPHDQNSCSYTDEITCSAKQDPLFGVPRVNEATGELFVEYLDLVIPGRGLDLVWGRTYRSKIGLDTPMGVNWDFSYNIRAALSGSNITVQDGQNRTDTYFLQGDGSFSTDELFRRGTLSGNVFTLQFADKTSWIFKPLDGSPTSGKIDRIVDRNSNQLQFQYNGLGQLFFIIDTLGRVFQISYDGNGRIQAVHDFAGREIQYVHHNGSGGGGSLGDLLSVTSQAVTGTPIGNDFPTGKTAQFTYSFGLPQAARNHNLLTARDGNNVQWFQAVYTTTGVTTDFLYDRVAREVVGTANETKVFTYLVRPSPNSGYGTTTKAIVNDAIGNVHELLFDSKNRLTDLRQFTGRSTPGVPVTETTNRPMNPVRPSDPAFFQTTINWNRDSLPTRITFPRGNGIEMVYQRDVDPATNPRERANLRVYRELPVTGSALVELVEHAAGFGTSEGHKAVNIAEFRFHGVLNRAEPSLSMAASSGRNFREAWFWVGRFLYNSESVWYDGDDFWTVHTDARGFTWTCARDANGNAMSVTRPDGVTTDIEHNANGQLTVIVWPQNNTGHRERDEWHYYSSGPQNGYLQSFIRDAGGLNLTTGFTHDSVGNVTQIVDPRGRDTQFFVNQLNQIVQVTSRNAGTPGRYLTNIYRDANNRITHVDVQNKDEFGNPGSPAFFVTSFGYDSLDHPTSITRTVDSGHNVMTQYFYNAIRDLIELRSPLAVSGTQPNARVQFAYDERDLPFTRTAAPGSPIATGSTYTYDLNGNLSRLETGAPAGPQHTTMFVYDGFDRLSQMTSPVGTQMQFSYNANHQPTQRTVTGTFLDANGNPTTGLLAAATWTYDSTGFCTARVDSFFDVVTQIPILDGARTTNYGYDPARNVIAVTDDNNHTTQFSYDGANRLSAMIDPKGNRVDYSYDANGNIITRTQTDKSDTAAPDQVFIQTYVYDGLDRLITSTDNVGNARNYLYDSRSNRVRYVDPRNDLTQFSFDGLNRLTRRGRDMNANGSGFDPNDIVTGYTWDDNSRFAGRTNPNNYVTQYFYDSLGRLTNRNNADTTSKTWSYDAWGNAIQSNDENATVCINNYDNNNRLRQRQITPGPGVSNATTFEIYDYPGDYSWRERAINNASTVRYTYDSLGRLTSERLGSQITNYTHDAVGNLLTLQSPGGRVLSYGYDAANLCRGLSLIATSDGDSLGPIANYSYIGHRIESDTHRNGTSTSYTYDGFVGAPAGSDLGWGQLAASETTGPGSVVVDQRTFSYDAAQNLRERQDTRAGGPQLLHHHDYDPADRLVHTQVTAPGPTVVRNTIYNYDLNGNRVAVNGFNTPDPGSYFQDSTMPVPADAQMNQYTSTPRGGYLYDKNGNRINLNGGGANTNYTYDYANRLVDLTNVNTGLRIANYQYDTFGRRIQKTLDPDGTPNVTNFFYSGRSVLEERDGGGAVTAAFTLTDDPFFFDIPAELLYRAAAQPGGADSVGPPYFGGLQDDPFFFDTPAELPYGEMRRGGTNYTYATHNDGLNHYGNFWCLTGASGAAAERYEYEDFGDPHFFDGSGNPLPSSAIGNPYLFKGMRFDGESGLYLTLFGTAGGNNRDDWQMFNQQVTMFDPKIGASLQRESSHAVNSFQGTEAVSRLFNYCLGPYTPLAGNWDGL